LFKFGQLWRVRPIVGAILGVKGLR